MIGTTSFPLTWDLDCLGPHPESTSFRQLLQHYADDLKHLAVRSNSLPPLDDTNAGDLWGAIIADLAELRTRTEDLHSFIGCHAAADAANRHFQQIEGELSALLPLLEQVMTNLELGCAEVSEDIFQRFISTDGRLQANAFFLRECRKAGAFRLPREQESLLNALAVDGLQAWSRLYDRLSGELRVTVMEKGELVSKSPGQVTWDSPERAVRENNFHASQRAWATIADSCAEALNHISGSRLTKYARLGIDHLALPLQMNRMKRETLDVMWSVISERKPVLTKYLAKKAELLGIEKLHIFDLHAPLNLTARATGRVAWDEACQNVVQTFHGYSEELGNFAERALRERWVEAENRSGKRQGGFCTGFRSRKQSRIFMTFTESADSMSTLAHELGHAYHSYVLQDQPPLLQDYPMNLAETASTLGEAILGERRLAQASATADRLDLLDHMLGDAVAFLMNIHCRFLFEDRYHQERRQGELSRERFTQLMREAQQEAYCGALAEEGWQPGFWISKLHFYIANWPFYNFPYTFGYLLSLGIYRLRDELPDFPSRVREFLIATGCRRSEDAVLEAFGADLTGRDFWSGSLDVVDQRVEQFLNLADRL